jgi:hypothetical protein
MFREQKKNLSLLIFRFSFLLPIPPLFCSCGPLSKQILSSDPAGFQQGPFAQKQKSTHTTGSECEI